MFTTPRTVAKRQKNRVYFDYLQIGKSKTIAAPYVLRAYEGAPVATPLEWAEVRPGLDPKQFTIANARQRFREKGDLFRGVLESPQSLQEALGKLAETGLPPGLPMPHRFRAKVLIGGGRGWRRGLAGQLWEVGRTKPIRAAV